MSDNRIAAPRVDEDRATTASGATWKLQGGTIVAYRDGSHRIIKDGEIVIRGDRIISTGARTAVNADRTVELAGRVVIPGLISTHAHIGAHEATRLILDGGRREFMRSGFLNYVPTREEGGPSLLQFTDRAASVRFGFAQLVRNGVTTVLGFAPHADELMVEAAGEVGIRLYFAPTANAGRYHFDESGKLKRTLSEREGRQQLAAAQEFIASHSGRHDGRVCGVIVVDEFYNSTPGLRRAAKQTADSLGVGLTMHFCEQLFEFHETVRTTGLTPVQILEREEVLGPRTILAHCIYIAGHRMTSYPYVNDLAILAKTGTSVAHSPVVFARRGVFLESFQRYCDSKINMAIGTDVFPMDLIEEMRFASIMGKVADQNHESSSAGAVFDAATLGGAKALGRDDLGRIAPGAKADLVVLDLQNIWTSPFSDPIRAIVTNGHPSMIDYVIVDGRIVFDAEQPPKSDCDLLASATRSMRNLESRYPEWHWAGHSANSEFPPSYPPWTL